MTRAEAVSILGVAVPTTVNALKTAYHRKALEVHPDKCERGNPDAHLRFLAVQAAYELLAKDTEAVTEPERDVTIDGFPLSEFGKGLGPTVNGKPCPSCSGKGYVMTRGIRYTFCCRCEGSGEIKCANPVLPKGLFGAGPGR